MTAAERRITSKVKVAARVPRTRIRVRWWIFLFLFLFPMLAYVQRTSLSVIAQHIMSELRFSQMQVGWLMWAFTVTYTVLQIPASLLGERIGARATFVVVGCVSCLATIATPLAPALLSGTSLFIALLISQAVPGGIAFTGITGVRRCIRGLVSRAPLGFRERPGLQRPKPGYRPDTAAARGADVILRLAAGSALDCPTRRRIDPSLGLVCPQHTT